MSHLPTGTVTFLFTDIEASTRLLQHLGDTRAAKILEEHRRLLRRAVAAGGGHEIQDQGDGFLVAFKRARDAVATAVTVQQAISSHPWPEGVKLRVRMGMHTGEPVSTPEGYVGVDVHRAARICSAGYGGQVLLSQATRNLVEHDLPADAGLRNLGSHRLKDLQRSENIFQLLHPDLPSNFPPLKTLDHAPNNLPRHLTSFVGREREISEITQLLSTTRLLTLTGAGGSGKTRLALHVAAEMLDDFRDGIWLVELGKVSDAALIPQSVASTLGVREEYGGLPLLDALVDFVRDRVLLLVLDNCEHLLGACAELATTLLRVAPTLRILATSREALRIGEPIYYVQSLSLPDAEQSASPEYMARYEAVRLFAERAASRLPGFRIDDNNAHAVAEVCRRLDGMPLAIELAAARVTVLTVEQIAARLNDRFRLLIGRDPTTLPQHRTLRATMDWSYQLLSEAEQGLLRRLAVFAGGFTFEAVEAICAGDKVKAEDVLDLLTHLVDRSLLVPEHARDTRYRLLETVREYGWEKLLERGELSTFRSRHRDWYLALVERAEPDIIKGPNQREWLGRFRAEDANLRTALEWSYGEESGTEAMLRLAGALWWYWFIGPQWNEAREWLKRALSRPDSALFPVRSKALYGLAVIMWLQGDAAQAIALARESLTLSREQEDKWGMACAIFVLGAVATERGETDQAVALLEEDLELLRGLGYPAGMVLYYLGYAVSGFDYERATELFQKSLAVLRETGDRRGIALLVGTLGDVAWLRGDYRRATELYGECGALGRELGYKERIAYSFYGLGGVARTQGDYTKARALLEQGLVLYRQFNWKTGVALCLRRLGTVALEQGELTHAQDQLETALGLFQELGQKSSIGDSLNVLGILARLRGDLARAVTLHEEALALFREAKDRLGVAASLLNQGKIAYRHGDRVHAAGLYLESVAIRREFGYRLGVAEGVEALAALAADHQYWESAAHLFGAAEALRNAIGAVIPSIERGDYDRTVTVVRVALGEVAEVKWAEGRALSVDQALERVPSKR